MHQHPQQSEASKEKWGMEKEIKITTTSTYLSLAIVISLLGIVVSGTWAALGLQTRLTKIDAELIALRVEIARVQERIDVKMGDRWTATMMAVWAREFQNLNRTNMMIIPVVQEIQQRYPPGSLHYTSP